MFFTILLAWVVILSGGLLLLLSACESEPDMSHRVPKEFPIEKIIYSKVYYFSCAINVFVLEEGFRYQFSEELLKQLDENESKRTGRQLKEHRQWQKTPIYNNLHYNSQTSLSVDNAKKCLKDRPYFLDLFKKYSSEIDSAYFRDGGDIVFLYLPFENILVVAE